MSPGCLAISSGDGGRRRDWVSDVSSPCVVTCGRERYTMLVTKAVEVASMHPQPCPQSHRALCNDKPYLLPLALIAMRTLHFGNCKPNTCTPHCLRRKRQLGSLTVFSGATFTRPFLRLRACFTTCRRGNALFAASPSSLRNTSFAAACGACSSSLSSKACFRDLGKPRGGGIALTTPWRSPCVPMLCTR